ncbi:hypothetical protein [Streptomyces sp. DH-12]|uniref:hypothetical protein n=1 Tax=Streptomyces sp. DH-12 TaxID=2072509 RepID=UPI001F5311B8|nr:hypothetical protein [Streptomyces sp. DH-12]
MLDVLHRDQVALRIHDGAFSAMDLTARHPRTGELLSTVKFTVQTLAAAGELQRDLQRELTYDGLRAAEAKGSKGGRRPAVAADRTTPCAPRTWRAVRSPPSPATTGSAAARSARPSRTSCPTTPPLRRMPPPGAAGHPRHAGQARRLPPRGRLGARRAGRARPGGTVRRGQGYTLRVTAVPAVHRRLLDLSQPLDGAPGAAVIPAQRKARREYANRVTALGAPAWP